MVVSIETTEEHRRDCLRLSERIGFEEVRVGDRIRVSYVEGSSKSGWLNAGVRRSVASQVAAGALGKVWLSEDGHVIAHVGWPQMEIYRLV